ncbi:hypothetical protein [Helicobacter sp. 11S02596-1]|uniref:hypothetical protein n=1 Tax=Helicobacter sp. 11S02596-1 TaxID=1476194 RepID=UPI000BA52510|nr:hypothetical protein [Helicobacter sp. 11S02596-1]
MQKETFFQYLKRKIQKRKGAKNQILFSTRVLQFPSNLKKFFDFTRTSHLYLIENAIADPNGLGGLELKLHNAHVPREYCDIFYNLLVLSSKKQMGGGA